MRAECRSGYRHVPMARKRSAHCRADLCVPYQYRTCVRSVVLLHESLSSENTPFAKLLRLAKNTGSSAARPVSPQVNEVDPRKYEMYHLLTPTECIDVAERYRAGASATDLARQYNVHRQTIARQLKKAGIELRDQKKRSPELTAEATILYAEGRSLDDVAKLLGVQASTIARSLKSAGVQLRPAAADRWHRSRDDRT